MTEPRWLERKAIELLHSESIAEFGGLPGLKNEGALESALSRPVNQFAYVGVTDLAQLAAAYAFGFARNHSFNDGNKRKAFIAAALFLARNGKRLKADQVEAYERMMALAAGEIGQDAFADWVRANLRPR